MRPSTLRLWLSTVSVLPGIAPSRHIDDCLSVLTSSPKKRGLPLIAEASLLRSLLLCEAEDLRLGASFIGRVLSSSTKSAGPANTEGNSKDFLRSTLADAAWILNHRLPRWFKPPLSAHHEAVLEIASTWTGQIPARSSGNSKVEDSVAAALERLGSRPERDTVCVGLLCLPLALPSLRLALLIPGRAGELKDLTVGSNTFGEDRTTHPLWQVRRDQLKQHGWNVEMIFDSEWPLEADDSNQDALHSRQELVLRRKLALALQARVPSNRQRRDLSYW